MRDIRQPARGTNALEGAAPWATRQRQLFMNYSGMAARWCRRWGVRDGDVDDVVQRVFLIAFSKLDQVREEAEQSFLAVVTRREASHMRRSYRRRSEVGAEELAPQSSGAPRLDEHLHQQRRLHHAELSLAAMEDALRVVWLGHEWLGHSCQEIAEMEGAPLGTVKSRLRKARQLLSQKMTALAE